MAIIDPVSAAGLVAREIRTGERDGAPTRVAVARRAYPTEPADLWDCLTNPERIPRWFLPVTGELAEGGKYQVVGNAGGTVESCDEPRAFAVTSTLLRRRSSTPREAKRWWVSRDATPESA